MNLEGKIIWITGASSGIGLELAKQALQANATVLLSSSNKEKLNQAVKQCEKVLPHHLPSLNTASEVNSADIERRIYSKQLDVSSRKSINSAVEYIGDHHWQIDILINNAGIGQSAFVIDTNEEVERRIMEVNYWGCVNLTKAMLPLMKNWGGGQIAITNSVLGLFSIPMRSSYCASKHALQGYFASLACECAGDGIDITQAYPGRIATPFANSSLTADGQAASPAKLGHNRGGMSSGECARQFWRAIIARRRRVVIARSEKIALLLHWLSPSFYLKLLQWAMKNDKLRRKITPP